MNGWQVPASGFSQMPRRAKGILGMKGTGSARQTAVLDDGLQLQGRLPDRRKAASSDSMLLFGQELATMIGLPSSAACLLKSKP